MNSMKRQKDMTLEDKSPRSEGVQYTTEQRNTSRNNEEAGPKLKRYSVVDISGGESKVQVKPWKPGVFAVHGVTKS